MGRNASGARSSTACRTCATSGAFATVFRHALQPQPSPQNAPVSQSPSGSVYGLSQAGQPHWSYMAEMLRLHAAKTVLLAQAGEFSEGGCNSRTLGRYPSLTCSEALAVQLQAPCAGTGLQRQTRALQHVTKCTVFGNAELGRLAKSETIAKAGWGEAPCLTFCSGRTSDRSEPRAALGALGRSCCAGLLPRQPEPPADILLNM